MTSCAFPASLSSLSTPFSLPNFSFSSLHTIPSPVTSHSSSEPKKPRKNRSAYTLFALDVKPKLKTSSNFKMSCVDLQTTISQLWKNLSPEEKKKYQDQANEEKLHYMLKLKKFYENAAPETIEEATKPKPKRPYSAYCYFVKEIRQVINLPDTKFKMQEILKQASEKWRMLSEEDKAVYHEKARQAKEAYSAESTDFSDNTPELIKPESVESDHGSVKQEDKQTVKSQKTKKSASLNKKRGIHFPKEIQEKMDLIEQSATTSKKVKTDSLTSLTDLRAQLGIPRMSPLLPTDNNKQETIQESARKMQVEQTWPIFAQRQAGNNTTNTASLTQAWPLSVSAPLVNQSLNLAREMNLMMGYEQVRRNMLSLMLLNKMTQNINSVGCSFPLETKIEVKAETH